MRVLMTGGAGFIGGHAYDHFTASGDEVLVIDKMTYAADPISSLRIDHLEKIDICDTPNLSRLIKIFKPDVVLNFAAETHVDNSIESSRDFVVTNVLGTTSVLDACVYNNVKLCHISTDEVYGPADSSPFFEGDRLMPKNPYAATKASAELMIQAYQNTHKVACMTIRPSNNYGPRQHNEKLVPKLIRCIETGERFPLYGEGDQVREWTYVQDTARIVRSLIVQEQRWNSVYNVSSGISRTNRQTIETVISTYNRVFGSQATFEDVVQKVVDRKGHDRRYWIDSHKSLSAIGGFDFTSFEMGVEETVRQYNSHSED